MFHNKVFAVVGGDLRSAHLANTLADRENGYKIYGMLMEHDVKLSGRIHKSNDIKLVFPQSDIIVFPLPMLGSDGKINTPLARAELTVEECFDYIPPEAVVLAGKVPLYVKELALEREIDLVDYLDREEFAVLNAVPTAEGAVEIALSELPSTLFGSTCMITGFGRISKVLARLLLAFGARVQVVARKYSDLAWIKLSGCTPVHIADMSSYLPQADVLFNTVPEVILGEEKLARLKRSCLVVDLASKPGGVDFTTAQNLGLKTIWALSLPGKVAPMSAGEIMLDTIFNILGERGIV